VTAPLDTDLAIVGSGFGGSLLAMIARRLGLRVALLERGTHPRFAVGESASPLAGVVIEQLAQRYDLPRLAPLASYGAWQRHYAHLTCGLKRGFTYYKHEEYQPFGRRIDRSNELLVAASPSDKLSDTHWLRADVDQFLMQEAVALGADYVDELRLDEIAWRTAGAVLSGVRRGQSVAVNARLVVDASGPRGFLSRVLDLGAPGFDGYPSTQALYSHFTGVARCADMAEFASAETPPYPVDAAALHHVFDGGWMWVLRFDSGVTSAGVAVTDALAADLRLADGEPAWHRLLARYPSVAAQFADATPIREFTWMPRVAWRTTSAAGEGWEMLPSAAAFVDPLFSTGIPMTLLGVERLARKLGSGVIRLRPRLRRDRFFGGQSAADGDVGLAEADHVARFIAGCYAAFPRFEDFTAWSMFYFAAASFSEMSRRLHGDAWSRGFLLKNDDRFVAAMSTLAPSRGTHSDLAARVAAAIERVNVAGLADRAKRNWYGIDVEDTVRAAPKLDAAPEAIRALYAGLSTKSNSAVTYGG
jgi:tetracycline 7-halogenase / FADH2 O2-dependent halogenase